MQHTGPQHLWDRRDIWFWAWMFLLSATTVTAFSTTAGLVRWWALVWVALAVGWFWLMVGRLTVLPRSAPRRLLIYFAGMLLLFSWAMQYHPIYYFLVAGLFMQAFYYMEPRWSILVAFCLTGAMILSLFIGETMNFPFWTIAGIVFSMVLGIGLAIFIEVIIGQSLERKQLITDLQAARSDLARVERQAGVLQERTRLAGEIHDTLAQGFISIILHLEAAEPHLTLAPPETHQHVALALQTSRDNLAEARRLVWALRPLPLEGATLTDALQRVANQWAEANATLLHWHLSGTACQIHPHVEVLLLRLLQESLANIRKHAQAHAVRVSLSYLDDLMTLDIQDDGQGFDVEQWMAQPADGTQAQGGWGLAAMRSRFHAVGGTLAIESVPLKGTIIAGAVPPMGRFVAEVEA